MLTAEELLRQAMRKERGYKRKSPKYFHWVDIYHLDIYWLAKKEGPNRRERKAAAKKAIKRKEETGELRQES